MKDKFFGLSFNEIPIFETLLVSDKKIQVKLSLKLKKIKKIININKKYNNKFKSSLKKLMLLFLKKIKL